MKCGCSKLQCFSIEEGSRLESLEKNLLRICKSFSRIEIPYNSSIVSIGNNFISFSSIEVFFILSSVENIDDEWFNHGSCLKTVTISPLNKHFKYLDQNNNIIVGKSDPKIDIFDTIIFHL